MNSLTYKAGPNPQKLQEFKVLDGDDTVPLPKEPCPKAFQCAMEKLGVSSGDQVAFVFDPQGNKVALILLTTAQEYSKALAT